MKTIQSELKINHNVEGSLQKEFREALKNPDFENLRKEIPLKDEIIMKYTSILETCSEEFGHCKKCHSLLECQNAMMGYAYLPRVQEESLNFEYQMCQYQKNRNKEVSYQKNVSLYDMPKEIREASLKQIYMSDKNRFEVIAWLDDFLANYEAETTHKGLYLYGNFGCGKSYLIAALFNEMAKKNVKSVILFWPEFLRDLKSSFQTDFKEKMEKIKKVPLLLLDDIGAENTTAWGRDEILGPIVQYRMQEGLATFFTSNLDLEELEHHFEVSKENVDSVKARRIIERIKQLSEPKKMVSKNLRK